MLCWWSFSFILPAVSAPGSRGSATISRPWPLRYRSPSLSGPKGRVCGLKESGAWMRRSGASRGRSEGPIGAASGAGSGSKIQVQRSFPDIFGATPHPFRSRFRIQGCERQRRSRLPGASSQRRFRTLETGAHRASPPNWSVLSDGFLSPVRVVDPTGASLPGFDPASSRPQRRPHPASFFMVGPGPERPTSRVRSRCLPSMHSGATGPGTDCPLRATERPPNPLRTTLPRGLACGRGWSCFGLWSYPPSPDTVKLTPV